MDRLEFHFFFRSGRNTCEQSLRVGVKRVREEIEDFAFFHDLTSIHHGDFVSHLRRHSKIMGNQED